MREYTHTHNILNNNKSVLENKDNNKAIVQGCIPSFIALTIEIFFDIFNADLYFAIGALFFQTLIIYLIYGILIGITKKLSTSTIITSILATIFLVINQVKIAYTGEPIVFSDLNFISNINGIFNMISKDLLILAKYYLPISILLVIVFCLIIIWTRKNELIVNNIKIRLIAIISSIIVFIILFIPNQYTKNIFLSLFLNINEYKDYASYTTNLSYYKSHSLFAGMYGVLLNNRFEEPQNYNEEELNNVLQLGDNKEVQKNWGMPNIVVLFSESFWDVDMQSDVTFNKLVAPNIKRLKQEGKLVETLSCAYGGASENVAFELLTGGSLKYFTKGYIPTMSLYKRNNSEKIPSIVKELKNNNYSSKIIFGKDYYNSKNTMEKIGFDEYIELEETEENIKGNYISDEYMINTIIKDLENKNKNEKIFYIAETIQNHMPFNAEKYGNYDISIKQSNLTPEENDTILSYAQGVHDADKQLNRLYEYIQNYEEPTILIFLGDHLPYLYTEKGNNALESISYFNTGNELEDIYRKYNTQALILSNYNIDTSGIPNYLSNDLLLTYIVNQMDIQLSNYYKWLYTTTEILPATNLYISLDLNGQIYDTQELQGNMQIINELRKNMQYKLFIKSTQ